ncbi:MAG: 50S ribosomal protein L18 [Actinomycetota bacterium]
MMLAERKREARQRRHRRVRKRIRGAAERPRLAVYRSNRHIYAQLVDDATGRTLVAASSLEADAAGKGDKKAAAKRVGELIAKRAKDAGVERAVLDRGGRLYHGRVRSVADAARKGGLQI